MAQDDPQRERPPFYVLRCTAMTDYLNPRQLAAGLAQDKRGNRLRWIARGSPPEYKA